jgi:hypothetical protein
MAWQLPSRHARGLPAMCYDSDPTLYYVVRPIAVTLISHVRSHAKYQWHGAYLEQLLFFIQLGS